jgi:hypothetical protein
MTKWMKLLKDVGMLNEASPESIRSSMRMDTVEALRLSATHHPSTESLTLQLSARVGVVGGFFLKLYLVWRVDNPCPLGQWTVEFPCNFYLGVGGKDLFSFQPMGRPKVPCFYSF